MARWSWFPMLKRRGKWWSYRKAVPQELRPFFGGRYEIVVAPKTQDEGVARLRVLEVAMETEKAIQRARAQYKSVARDPHKLAAQWRVDVLREDQQDRIDRPREDDEVDEHGDTLVASNSVQTEIDVLMEKIQEAREALEANDTKLVQSILKDVMARHKVTLSSSDERKLAHAMLKENASALDTMLTRARGDWRAADAPVAAVPTISEVVERWIGERKPPSQTKHEVKAVLARFLKVNGGVDLEIGKIGKREVRAFREHLLSPDAKTGQGRGALAAATIKKNLTLVSVVLKYAVGAGWIDSNPAAGMTSVARGKTQDLEKRRMPFSDEAVRVFLANVAKKGETMRWVGTILFYTGARLAEVGNLRGTDVQERDGIVGFSIQPGEGTTVKTPTAVRFVPVHSALLKAGLVEPARERGDGFLFADLKADVHGKRTSLLSKTFGRCLRAWKLDQGGRVVIHSARHTVTDKLRESGTQEAVISAILGHANKTSQTAGYGRGWSARVMRDAIETIRY